MPDIFLSYASKDRARAGEVAAALTSCGWDVWWDRTLIAGDRYAAVIAEKLAQARCVVVLWSKASAASDWVSDEANEAKKRGVYLPVLLDETEPPLGFRRTQHANLASWTGSLDDHELRRLLDGIRRHVGPGIIPPPPGFIERIFRRLGFSRRAILGSALAALPMVALAVSLVVLARMERPAQIVLAVTVSRATLTSREALGQGVLSTFPTSALTVTEFQDADIGFATIESTGPKLRPGRVRLMAAKPTASVTFRNVQCEGLQMPSRVALAWRDGTLTLTALVATLTARISTGPRLTLACDGCTAAGNGQEPAPLADSQSYTFAYANSQIATIRSASPGGLTLDAPVGSVLTAGTNILLDAVDFVDVDDNGQPVSSIVSGRLAFVGLRRSTRQLGAGEFVTAKELDGFYLTRVAVDGEGLSLEMHGRVGQLGVGRAGIIEAEQPSRLEEVMSQSPWVVYAGSAAAVGLSVGILWFVRPRSRV
jgi:hypothetical protein